MSSRPGRVLLAGAALCLGALATTSCGARTGLEVLGTAGKAGASGRGGSGGGTAGTGGAPLAGTAGSAGTAGTAGSAGTGGGGTGGTGGTESCPSGTGGFAGSGQAGSTVTCTTVSSLDDDGDGYSDDQGDCNDCDPAINPAAFDFVEVDANGAQSQVQIDQDCSGSPSLSELEVCDGSLVIDDADAMHAAFAMDLCRVATNGSWGVLDAEYVTVDGKPMDDLAEAEFAHLGHGLLDGFGALVLPFRGSRLFALSSGSARQPKDAGYHDPYGFEKGYTSGFPPGFPIESPACSGTSTGAPHDSAALRLTLRVPKNARSFSFRTKFYTWEYPDYICSPYNDFFIVLMDPPPPDVDQVNKNIAFDSQGNPISVNNSLLDECDPQIAGGKDFSCDAGTAELTGTGFESHAATSWLTTTAPVVPGSVITLTFAVFDSQDSLLDSTGLIDDFRWSSQDVAKTCTGK